MAGVGAAKQPLPLPPKPPGQISTPALWGAFAPLNPMQQVSCCLPHLFPPPPYETPEGWQSQEFMETKLLGGQGAKLPVPLGWGSIAAPYPNARGALGRGAEIPAKAPPSPLRGWALPFYRGGPPGGGFRGPPPPPLGGPVPVEKLRFPTSPQPC